MPDPKDKIFVSPSPSADTRSADHAITEYELLASTTMHIGDVSRTMAWLSRRLLAIGENHDWTKIKFFDEFYRQFHKAQETGEWGTGWYDEIHVVKERHHLEARCPEDVTLLDVLEQIADCVCAGMARTGRFEPRPLDPAILSRAYMNTQKMLADSVLILRNTESEAADA